MCDVPPPLIVRNQNNLPLYGWTSQVVVLKRKSCIKKLAGFMSGQRTALYTHGEEERTMMRRLQYHLKTEKEQI